MPWRLRVLHKLLVQLVRDVAILMNKIEAFAVLHEFYDACKKSGTASNVSLEGSQVSHIFTGGYEIKMKCELDRCSRDILKSIIKRNNLTMSEQNGYVILKSLGH
jgi:hypothetical protein